MMNEEMDTTFSIEDVQATLDTENSRERVEIPAGEYVCEIKAPLSNVRQDSKGHNKILMPIEITGNAQFDGQWIFEAIYMNNQHDDAGVVKDGIGKRKVAKYAHALGMKKLSNLSELEGKHVKVTYGPNKRGYNEVSDIVAFGSNPSPPVDDQVNVANIRNILATPQPKKEEAEALPF
jgi:hypothetical protein